MYKSKIYYWFFVAFCQILGKSILTMLWPYALLQRWGGCAEKRELVVFQPNYISCATKTKIAIDEQDNGEEMWNRERDRSENDRVFLMHMCALIHDVTFLYAGIAQWGFLLSVLSVIMPRWAEPRRHTVVCLCMCHSVCAWCSESLVKKLALILAEHGDIDSCFKTNYKNLSFNTLDAIGRYICPRAGIAQRGRHIYMHTQQHSFSLYTQLTYCTLCISKYTTGKLPLCSCGNDCLCVAFIV